MDGENTNQENQEPQDELEVAELAGKIIREKDENIAKLKKELARQKLLSPGNSEEEEPARMSKEECIKTIEDPNVSNYDYAQAVITLSEIEKENGQPNPLGENGDAVVDFFKDVIDACDGDKGTFAAIYQAKLPDDDPKTKMAYNKRKRS